MDEETKKALEEAKRLEKEHIPSEDELKKQDNEFQEEAKTVGKLLADKGVQKELKKKRK